MLEAKVSHLEKVLKELSPVIIAFSGGVDSTYLLKKAIDCLSPDKVLAVTAISPIHQKDETAETKTLARLIGSNHKLLSTDELADATFVDNPPERCYYCKKLIFNNLVSLASELGFKTIIDGTNADDFSDYRPGIKALKEMDIQSPLLTAGLLKSEIRQLAQKEGLPNWNKPSSPCLASRIPYGQEINIVKLRQIEAAEDFLHSLGYSTCRVRHHGDIARLELPVEVLTDETIWQNRDIILAKLKSLGFPYVTIDLAGFKSGSLNEVLKENSNGKGIS